MNVIINPGSGVVSQEYGAVSWRNADSNMSALVRETGLDLKFHRNGDRDETGRYPYLIWVKRKTKHKVSVDIPGIKQLPDAGGVFAPRLYVDGSSWMWRIAVGILQDTFRESK